MRILTAATLVLSVIFTHADKSFERSIEGKLVAVTGGAGDICSAIADKFLEHGASSVILIDINEEKGEKVKQSLNEKHGPGRADFIYGNVITDLHRIVKEEVPKYGLADVLVNCAGVLNEYDARKTIETNAMATIEWSDMMYELSRADKGGKGCTIINMSDMYGYTIDPFAPMFTAASASSMMYTMAKGHEMNHRHTDVRMFCIMPGFTNTSMTTGQMEIDEKNEAFTKFAKSWPWQTPNELADALMDLFPLAESGSAHTIEAGKHFKPETFEYISLEYIDSIIQK